jgi:hypothetical protein
MQSVTLRKKITHEAAPLLLPLSFLLTLSSAPAQQVAAKPVEEGKEEVRVLSPFEVSASRTLGYQANDTLAGTRINAQLKDIANSVQVVTKEFLEDTGATDLSELLIFTTATEVYGASGNAGLGNLTNNDGTSLGQANRMEPQMSTRVRGLASADLARDYFLSDIPSDPYITSEITINRGPNASLFGLGSPGGIINNAIDRAETRRTFGEGNLKFDQYGSSRASLNHNQVVLKGKLAVRIAALDSNQRFEQEQAKYDEKRYFVAATWHPLKNMVIRANFETGDGFGNRPQLQPPTDRISTWFDNGKPGYDPTRNQWYINGALVTNRNHSAQLASSTTRQMPETGLNARPVMFFDDPNSSIPGNNTYAIMTAGFRGDAAGRTTASFPISGDAYLRMMSGPRNLFARSPEFIVGARPDIPTSHYAYYRDPQITDLNIFDIRKHSLGGSGDMVHANKFDVYSFRAEKTWFNNNLGIEVAHQRQDYEAVGIEPYVRDTTSSLNVDINLFLMNGSPNPNFGRPIVAGRGWAQTRLREREASQAVGFAKYDFKAKHDGWSKHLGRHTLTTVYLNQSNSEGAKNIDGHAYASNAYNPTTARNGPGLAQAAEYAASQRVQPHTLMMKVQYLGPSMAGLNSLQDARIQGVTVPQVTQSSNNALIWDPFTSAFRRSSVQVFTAQDNPAQVARGTYNRDEDQIDSESAVLQSHFLKDHIVTTLTWRRDTVKSFASSLELDPVTGLLPLGKPALGNPIAKTREEQTSYGVVGHFPDKWLPNGIGLSAHYVDSQNFAAGESTVDIFNRPAPPPTGTTREYGITVSALNRRLYSRINLFESLQKFERGGSATSEVGRAIIQVLENNTPAQLAAAGWNLNDGSIFDPGMIKTLRLTPANPSVPNDETTWTSSPSASYFRDTLSKGMEIEVSFTPTTNWRLHFNATRVEAMVDNVMPFAKKELLRIANEVFEHPVIGNLFYEQNPVRLPDGTYDPQGLLRSRDDNVIREVLFATAPEGLPMTEIRKWRWNLVTNYTFDGPIWNDTLLKGFSVGAGVRWQDDVSIGSGLKEKVTEEGAIAVPDLDNLYYGPAETNIDAWINYKTRFLYGTRLSLQLRVRDLNAGAGKFIPIYANPDGQIALWRTGPERRFEFSAKLSF